MAVALPDDIMMAIFLRLRVETLLCCQCVCKLWRHIIKTCDFAYTYRRSSTARQILLFSCYTKSTNIKVYAVNPQLSRHIFTLTQHPIHEFTLSHMPIQNLGHGLFLMGGEVPLFLYNPVRGEKLTLPSPPTIAKAKESTYGLGFNYSTNQYKLVRVTKTFKLMRQELVTEVYTLGSNKWKQITAVPPPSSNMDMHLGMPAYGDIHWYGKEVIVSFMFTKEEFKVTPIPDSIISRWCFFNWIEDLAVLDTSISCRITMWVLRDYENTRWEKLYTIPTLYYMQEVPNRRNIATWEEDIVFDVTKQAWLKNERVPDGYHTLYHCNPKTGYITVMNADRKRRPLLIERRDIFHSYTANFDSLARYAWEDSTPDHAITTTCKGNINEAGNKRKRGN